RFLLRRSVNVNAPVISVRVGSFQTAQPDDAGYDRIAARRIRLQNFAGETAVVKNSADRRMVTDFLSNLKSAERRRHRTPTIAEAEFGGRNGVNCGIAAVVEKHQFLIAHTHDHVWLDDLRTELGKFALKHRQKPE